MGGFKRGALILEWPEDSEFSGLEVRVKRLSIKQLMHIERLGDLKSSEGEAGLGPAMSELLDAVAKGLLGWNYEDDDGTAVPATREALDDVDLDMILALVKAWTKGVAGVPLDSKPSSSTGEPEPPDDELASWLETSQQSLPEPVSS